MFVPYGSSMIYRVYDGPGCSEGSNDVTGDDNYVKAGFYSAGPVHRTATPAERTGLFLQWESGRVQQSPLYSPKSDPEPSRFESSGTMDLCVGLVLVDSEGLPQHSMETYIVTSWTNENRLGEVHIFPITTESA